VKGVFPSQERKIETLFGLHKAIKNEKTDYEDQFLSLRWLGSWSGKVWA
jgi:hypothetical protein